MRSFVLLLIASYALASGADAVVELSRTQITIDKNNNQSRETYMVVRLLNEKGRQAYQTVTIPYDATTQKCEVLLAQAARPDGKVIPVEKSRITEESRVADKAYANAALRRIRFPSVPDSGTVEWKFKVTQRRLTKAAGCAGEILLGDFLPVAKQELVIIVPRGRELHNAIPDAPFSQDVVGPRVESLGKTLRYSWEFRQDSALPREIAEPVLEKRLPRVCYSTFPTWREMGEPAQKQFARAAASSPEVKQKAAELAKGAVKSEALQDIYNYVAGTLRTVDLDLGAAGYEPLKAGQVLKQGSGNCRDKTCLLVSLLTAAGFNAYPLLVRRNDLPVVKETPGQEAFDWIIAMVMVNNNPVYLDPCSQFQPYGRLPEFEQGSEAFVLDPKNLRFIRLPRPDYDANVDQLTGEISVGRDGAVSGTIQGKPGGYYDTQLRARLNRDASGLGMPPIDPRLFLARLALSIATGESAGNRFAEAQIDSFSISDLADIFKPAQFSVSFLIPNTRSPGAGSAFIPQPILASDTIFALTRAESRRAGMVSLPWRMARYSAMIHPAEGMRAGTLPGTWFRENACARATIRWEEKPAGIEFRSEFMLKKPEMTPEDYLLVKAIADEFRKPELRRLSFQ